MVIRMIIFFKKKHTKPNIRFYFDAEHNAHYNHFHAGQTWISCPMSDTSYKSCVIT